MVFNGFRNLLRQATGLRDRSGNIAPAVAPTPEKPDQIDVEFSPSEPLKMESTITLEDQKYIAPSTQAYTRAENALNIIISGTETQRTAQQILDIFLTACKVDEGRMEDLKSDPTRADKAYALLGEIARRKLKIQELYKLAKNKEDARIQEEAVAKAQTAIQKIGEAKDSVDMPADIKSSVEKQPGIETQIGLIFQDLKEILDNPQFRIDGAVKSQAELARIQARDTHFTGSTGMTHLGAFSKLASLCEMASLPGSSTAQQKRLVLETVQSIRQTLKEKRVRPDVCDFFETYVKDSEDKLARSL